MSEKIIYEIMHGETCAAQIDTQGHCRIFHSDYMPCNLYPDDTDEELDSDSYYMMNILDYLVGNTDRHWGNWGFLIDNKTNRPVSLHPLMDFNQAFRSYDQLDGANCLTVLPRHMTQKEAAIKAVTQIGLNQIREIDQSWFQNRESDYQMFRKRLALLAGQCH